MNYSLLNASSIDDDTYITTMSGLNNNNRHNNTRNNKDENNRTTNQKEGYESSIIHKKRTSLNKTQRKPQFPDKSTSAEGFYSPKVNSLLNAIHNSPSDESDDEDNYSSLQTYIPLQPPESVGVQNTILKESAEKTKLSLKDDINNNTKYNSNSPSIIDDPEEYYKKMLPNGIPNMEQYSMYNNTSSSSIIPDSLSSYPQYNSQSSFQKYNTDGDDVLVTKLNYLIHLLEEQKSEKTGNILEEVILYSFLGIFIIFVIDSFTRLGKYTR